ncbi:MAG: protein adenylyltransferase SelO family protein [Myxococcota bacterium]
MEAILPPHRLELLPLLGEGRTGRVFQQGKLAIKVAHPDPVSRRALCSEARNLQHLNKRGAATPRLLAWIPDGRLLVRDVVTGTPLIPLLQQQAPSPALLQQLWELLLATRDVEKDTGEAVDFTPANILVQRNRPVLVDAGPRPGGSMFRRVHDVDSLAQALDAYLVWKDSPAGAVPLLPPRMPVNPELHVEVPVGAPRGGQLLWSNQRLMDVMGRRWTEQELSAAFNLATHGRPVTRVGAATRYQESLEYSPRGAKGDGRGVWVGRVPGAPYGTHDVMLKGVGRTPLAWLGKRYHQDGFVSLPRTLWEAAVAEELARLGFEVPRVLAIFSTGKSTLDNTHRRWPAAMAVRVASTHWRLGHLRRASTDGEQFTALLHHVGRALHGSSFDARRGKDQEELLWTFARNLGHNVGRSEALNILCFSTSPGNVRVDGHFLDFSTVRFFRSYLPDWRYLDVPRKVVATQNHWRVFVVQFAQCFRRAGLWSERKELHAARQATALFNGEYHRGYLEGFNAFAGLEPQHLARLTTENASALVRALKAARALRSEGYVESAAWGQRCPAPLLDVEGRTRQFVTAWVDGQEDPWRQWLTHPVVDVNEESAAVCRELVDQLSRIIPPAARRVAQPRSWDEVIRPAWEKDALARTCYQRNGRRALQEWRSLHDGEWPLPPGAYPYLRARQLARALGHVALPGLEGPRYEYVVGLTPKLARGIVAACRKVLGAALLGVVIHGSRVMTRERVAVASGRQLVGKARSDVVREGGPAPGASSDLDLKVFVDGTGLDHEEAELRLGAALRRLGAPFALPARIPPRQRIIVAPRASLVDAFRWYNGGPRRQQQGKPPIPECQVVVLHDARGSRRPSPRRVQALARSRPPATVIPLQRLLPGTARDATNTLCPLDVHMLEMVLRDRPDIPVPALEVVPDGPRFRVVAGEGARRAAERAGRSVVGIRIRPRP